MKSLNTFVTVQPRYRRSVNLSADQSNSNGLVGYIVTPNVVRSLEHILISLQTLERSKSFTLLGQYGSGKSAFSVFLHHLLSSSEQQQKSSLQLLKEKDSNLAKVAKKIRGKNGFLQICITARRTSLQDLLLSAIHEKAQEINHSELLNISSELLNANIEDNKQSKGMVTSLLRKLTEVAIANEYSGISLMIDEMGKVLEYATRDHTSSGDLYLLQEIAEFADRQEKLPFLFMLSLHQNLESYLSNIDSNVKNEWNKIHGRFNEMVFSESASSVMQIISESIQHKLRIPERAIEEIDNFAHAFGHEKLTLPHGMSVEHFRDLAKRAWPIHPSTFLIIPYIFKRLAQNERGLFAFLNSTEEYGFESLLQKQQDKFIRIEDLYDYFIGHFEIGSQFEIGSSLREASEIIRSRANLDQNEVSLIKTIGLIGEISHETPIKSTEVFLKNTIESDSDVTVVLEKLRIESLVSHRKLTNSYHVYTGTNVDLSLQYQNAEEKLSFSRGNMFHLLKKYLPANIKIARRHYLEKGILRFFSVNYTDSIDELHKYNLKSFVPSESGLIEVVISPATQLTIDTVLKNYHDVERVIFAIPKKHKILENTVFELAKLDWIIDNVAELRNDKIAYREINMRQSECLDLIESAVKEYLDPSSNECTWIYKGTVINIRNMTDINKLLSVVCDDIYPLSPVLKNELLVKNNPSSQAAGARKELFKLISDNAETANLGIDDYSPKRGIYESLLKNTFIHRADLSGYHSLSLPEKNDDACGILPLFSKMAEIVFNKSCTQISVDDLFFKLSQPPYGIPLGVSSLYFYVFSKINENELFFYQESSFMKSMELTHWETLIRRPKLFTVSGVRISGYKKKLVDRFSKAFRIEKPGVANIVRLLFKINDALPEVTRKSSLFPEEVQQYVLKFLKMLEFAKSPEQLLFIDLPECFGLPSLNEKANYSDEKFEELLGLINKTLGALRSQETHLLDKAKGIILQDLKYENWSQLTDNASYIYEHSANTVLTPQILSLKSNNTEAFLSSLTDKPFQQWSDNDFSKLSKASKGFALNFKDLLSKFSATHVNLNPQQIEQKNKLTHKITSDISSLNMSNSVIIAALNELLNQYTTTK